MAQNASYLDENIYWPGGLNSISQICSEVSIWGTPSLQIDHPFLPVNFVGKKYYISCRLGGWPPFIVFRTYC